MSRMPSMSVAEAEAILGPRGSIFVTADNKSTIKKWLTASGLPGVFAAGLAYKAMQAAYNDLSDKTLDLLRERAAEALADNAADDTATAVWPTSTTGASDSPITPSIPSQNGDVKAALDALRVLFGAAAPVDADKVREIMRAELPNLIPVTRLEVTHNAVTTSHEGMHHKLLPVATQVVGQNIPLLLVGPAGGGKSTAGEQIAHMLNLPFYLQGAASGTHEYIGYKDGAGQYHTTPFRAAFENGGLFMAEELDSGSPDVPLILNAGLANGHMSFPDHPSPIKRHADFRIIANANTYGNGADRIYVGRTQLDGATIDRFAILDWNYDESMERALCGNAQWVERVQALRNSAQKEKARIIISPRASVNGAKLLAAGLDLGMVENAVIWKGCDLELRRRIEAGAR